MSRLGHKLAAERQSRGASLDALAEKSGVGRAYLEALEREDFAALPGRAFGKFYIRVYAEQLGFDPSELLAEYDDLTRAGGPAPAAERSDELEPSPLRDSLRSALHRARQTRLARREEGPGFDEGDALGDATLTAPEATAHEETNEGAIASTTAASDADSAEGVVPAAEGAGDAGAATTDDVREELAGTVEAGTPEADLSDAGEETTDDPPGDAHVAVATNGPTGGGDLPAVPDGIDALGELDGVAESGVDSSGIEAFGDAVTRAPAAEEIAPRDAPAPQQSEQPEIDGLATTPLAVSGHDVPTQLPWRALSLVALLVVVIVGALSLGRDNAGDGARATEPNPETRAAGRVESNGADSTAAYGSVDTTRPDASGGTTGAGSHREPDRERSAAGPPSGTDDAKPAGQVGGSPASALVVTEHGVGRGVRDHRLIDPATTFPEGSEVAFLTRVVGGRRGDVVRHVWLRGGRPVQSIALRLGGTHWRTHSVKTTWGQGAWSVEARDADGAILAQSSFVVTPRDR